MYNFNPVSNLSTSGRISESVSLGSIRNRPGSITRVYKYCEQVSTDPLCCTLQGDCSNNSPIPSFPDDGKYQIITSEGGILYISNDYGNTFTENNNYYNNTYVMNIMSVACSVDFNYISMGINNNYTSYNFYQSNDSGNTFTNDPLEQPYLSNNKNKFWYNSMSGSGQYQIALSYGKSINQSGYSTAVNYFCTSNDYGTTWQQLTYDTSGQYTTSCMSYTGQYQVVVKFLNNSTSYVYFSTDYGASFTPFSNLITNTNLIGCAMSGDGQVITVGSDQRLYYSLDQGNTWYQSTVTINSNPYYQPFGNISSSYTGQYQVATSGFVYNNIYAGTATTSPKYGYYSNDYGKTWNVIPINITTSIIYLSVSISNLGQYMAINLSTFANNVSYYYYYLSSDYGETWNLSYTIINNATYGIAMT